MEFTEFGEGGNRRVLFLLGWGNRPDHGPVRWFVDRLASAGYVVDVGRLDPHVSDFDAAYRGPAQERHDATGPDRLLAHSTGGLVAAHLETAAPRVYMSPWWGMAGEASLLERLLVALPTGRPVIPVPTDREALGEFATDEQVADVPDRIAPAFLRTVADAQARLPPFRDDSVVFCTLSDRVVGVGAIGERAPADRVALYDGGHELFSASGRDRAVERVLAALDAGPSAL